MAQGGQFSVARDTRAEVRRRRKEDGEAAGSRQKLRGKRQICGRAKADAAGSCAGGFAGAGAGAGAGAAAVDWPVAGAGARAVAAAGAAAVAGAVAAAVAGAGARTVLGAGAPQRVEGTASRKG